MSESKPNPVPAAPPAATPPAPPAAKAKKALSIEDILAQKMAAGLSREQAIEAIEAQRREAPESLPKGKINPIASIPANLHPEVRRRVDAGLTLEQASEVVRQQAREDAARTKKTK